VFSEKKNIFKIFKSLK